MGHHALREVIVVGKGVRVQRGQAAGGKGVRVQREPAAGGKGARVQRGPATGGKGAREARSAGLKLFSAVACHYTPSEEKRHLGTSSGFSPQRLSSVYSRRQATSLA